MNLTMIKNAFMKGRLDTLVPSAKPQKTSEESKLYIHYGSSFFDPMRFRPIKNDIRPWIKPAFNTGLWASPIDSLNGWYAWCKDNEFYTENLTSSFKFKLKPETKILYINSRQDLNFIREHGMIDKRWSDEEYFMDGIWVMDFEKIRDDGYDAIEVVINSDTYYPLYGWDVDSLLVLNPDIVIQC